MDRRTAISYMLAGALALVALSAEAAEPIKIGETAPLSGPMRNPDATKSRPRTSPSTRSTKRAVCSAGRSNS